VTRDRRIGILLLAPLALAIAFSWARLFAELDDVPRDEDYLTARRLLEEHGFDEVRDALVILPAWSLRPLTVMGDLDPLSGDAIAARPLHRWARLWAIVEPDAERDRAALVSRRGAPGLTLASGRLTIERFDLPPPSVVYDLSGRLAEARVAVVSDGVAGGGRTPCAIPIRDGVSCGREGWLRVQRQWLLVSENGDRAVWSHPPAPGERLEIEWSDVPIGESIVVRAGFTRDGADRARAPVRLRVLVDGELAGTVTRKPAFSFHADVVDTERFAGRRATVTFAIDAGENGAAFFAWDATVLGKLP
jgi:hypothetical protein